MTVTQTHGEKGLHAWNTKRQNTDFDLYTEDLVAKISLRIK